jgi:hypothetical protein
LQGASATEQLLKENSNSNMRVFVIWEPVLVTDLAAPSTATLARVSDPRASQYWDRGRLLSHLLGEHDRSTVVWDHISIFAPGGNWKDGPPQPAYSGNPVVRVKNEAQNALQRLLEASTQSSGNEKK